MIVLVGTKRLSEKAKCHERRQEKESKAFFSICMQITNIRYGNSHSKETPQPTPLRSQ